MEQSAKFITKYHPGVWTPKINKYTCCSQVNRDAPGCENVPDKPSKVTNRNQTPLLPRKLKSPVLLLAIEQQCVGLRISYASLSASLNGLPLKPHTRSDWALSERDVAQSRAQTISAPFVPHPSQDIIKLGAIL